MTGEPRATPLIVDAKPRVALPAGSATSTEATQAIAGFGSVWILQLGHPHGWVVRVGTQPGRVLARIMVGEAPGSLAIAGGSVWVANTFGGIPGARGANTLSRIDPASNRVIATVKVEVGGPIAGGYGAVFVPGLGTGGSPLRKVSTASDKVVASFALTGIPTVACGSLWITRVLERDQPPYPAIINRIDPESGERITSSTIPEGSSQPAEADGRCLALTGANTTSDEPTESWIAVIDPAAGASTRSPRIPFRTAIMAGSIWIRESDDVIQRISADGVPQGPRLALPAAEVEGGNWTIVDVDGDTWIVGPSSVARLALPGTNG